MPRFLPRHLAPGASLAFSGSSLSRPSFSRTLFSRSRKQRPGSKLWIIDNRVVSYTPVVFRSTQILKKISRHNLLVYKIQAKMC